MLIFTRRQTRNFYQSAIIKLPYCVYQKHGIKKNHFFYFLQCLILQPQCKHSLALLFGFIKLTFSQKKHKAKKERERKSTFVSFSQQPHTLGCIHSRSCTVHLFNSPLLLSVKADNLFQMEGPPSEITDESCLKWTLKSNISFGDAR